MRSEDHNLLTIEEKSIILTEVNKVLNSGFRMLGFHGGNRFLITHIIYISAIPIKN